MANIILDLITWYKYINEDLADRRSKDYFMIGTPWQGLTVIGLYLYFIFNLGPRLMEKRQPFKLDRILQIYNVFQILINGFLFYEALTQGWLGKYNYFCEPIDYSDTPHALLVTRLVWLYFMIKLLDLMDTIFCVLRKKQNQVTFLHVYHHVGVLIASWCAVKYLPGGHATFLDSAYRSIGKLPSLLLAGLCRFVMPAGSNEWHQNTVTIINSQNNTVERFGSVLRGGEGLLNTFVHVIMYTYYLLASMKIKTSAWKKYITQLQLVQFFLIACHYLQLIWVEDCGFPIWPVYIMVPQNLFMMLLFGDFYYKTYTKKKPEIKTMTKTEINGTFPEINGKPKEQ